jgi:hypothetical protein
MTLRARLVASLVERAREASAMRVTAGTANPMTADAQSLACATVAARTASWVEACCTTVLPSASTDPVGRMRTSAHSDGSTVSARVTVETEPLVRVTRRAQSRAHACFIGVPLAEASPMQTCETRPIE